MVIVRQTFYYSKQVWYVNTLSLLESSTKLIIILLSLLTGGIKMAALQQSKSMIIIFTSLQPEPALKQLFLKERGQFEADDSSAIKYFYAPLQDLWLCGEENWHFHGQCMSPVCRA